MPLAALSTWRCWLAQCICIRVVIWSLCWFPQCELDSLLELTTDCVSCHVKTGRHWKTYQETSINSSSNSKKPVSIAVAIARNQYLYQFWLQLEHLSTSMAISLWHTTQINMISIPVPVAIPVASSTVSIPVAVTIAVWTANKQETYQETSINSSSNSKKPVSIAVAIARNQYLYQFWLQLESLHCHCSHHAEYHD